MQAIHSLIGGVNGAALGTAVILRRGTSVAPTLYASFEGDLHPQSGQTVDLDSYGRAVVYVNQLVDVTVRDVDGNELAVYTEGEASPNVEVRSLSFTGTDYVTGASAAGNPTTLQHVLDLWKTSSGALDFNVLAGGASLSLQRAFASIAGIFVNVKDPAYGAVGDGLVDDTASIQAALTAAGAQKSIVFFPAGTYKTSATLSVPVGVSVWGAGSGASTITSNSAANANVFLCPGQLASTFTGLQEFRGIAIAVMQANSGDMISLGSINPVRVRAVNCVLGSTSHTGNGIQATTDGNEVFVEDTVVIIAGGTACCVKALNNSTRISVQSSLFSLRPGAFNAALVTARYLTATGCRLDMSPMTSGTAECILQSGNGGGIGPQGSVVGCSFTPGGSGTSYALALAASNELNTNVTENGNVFTGTWSGGIYFGWGADTNNPKTMAMTRENTSRVVTDNSAAVDVKADQFGTTVVTRTGAGAQQFTSSVGPVGSKWTLMVYNNSGGALSFTFGTGFAPGTAGIAAVANTKISSQRFECIYIAGGAAWVPISAETRTT